MVNNTGNSINFQATQSMQPFGVEAEVMSQKSGEQLFDVADLPPTLHTFQAPPPPVTPQSPSIPTTIEISTPSKTKESTAVSEEASSPEKESPVKKFAEAVLTRISAFLKGALRLTGAVIILALLPAIVTIVVIGALIGCAAYHKDLSAVSDLAKDTTLGMLLGSAFLLKTSYDSFKETITGQEEANFERGTEHIEGKNIQLTIGGETRDVPLKLYKTTTKTNRLVELFSKGLNDTFGRVVYFGTNRLIRSVRNLAHRNEAVFNAQGVVTGRKNRDVFSDTGLKENKASIVKMHESQGRTVNDLGSDTDGLKVGNEKIDGLFIRANKEQVNVPTAIYFCGAGDFYESRKDMTAYYAELGMNVLVFNYRGYGHSDGGTTSHDSLSTDAEAVYQYALKMGVDASNIVVHGHSLGGLVSGDLKGNHPEITYIADRAPSDLADTLKLRQDQHSGLFKVLSGLAYQLIQQLGQNFSPKSRIRDLHAQGKVGRVFCIDCRDDKTLFQAKVGQDLVGKGSAPEVGRKSFEPESPASKNTIASPQTTSPNEDMSQIIPAENRYVTDGVAHGGRLVSVERIKTAEYLTKENLITSTRFFFAILEEPAGSYNVTDVYKALHSWYGTILNSNNTALKAEFIEQFQAFEETRTNRSNYLADLKVELDAKKAGLEKRKGILERGTYMDRKKSSVSIEQLTEQISAIDNRLDNVIVELNGLRAGLRKVVQWDAALPPDIRLNLEIKNVSHT